MRSKEQCLDVLEQLDLGHIARRIGDDFFEYIHRFVDFGTAGIATEFPILCLLFKVGVIGFIAYIALMLLIPGYELLRKKKFVWSRLYRCVLLFDCNV